MHVSKLKLLPCLVAALTGCELTVDALSDDHARAGDPIALSAAREPFLASQGDVEIYLTEPESDGPPPVVGALVAAIDAAERRLDVAAYDFDQPDIVDAVLAAQARGVAVRFVGDGDEIESEGYRALVDSGVPMALRRAGDRIMHHKFVVIDGVRVATGSMNLSTAGVRANDNDFALIADAELAAAFEAEFEQMFVEQRFGRRKGPVAAPVGGSGAEVHFGPGDAPLDALRGALASADHRVFFAVFAFTHDDVRDDLLALHGAGVEVHGVIDRLMASNRFSEDETLARAGVGVRIDGNERRIGRAGGKLHHKLLIVDAGTDSDPMVLTGSMNWSAAGARDNDEALLVLRGPEAVARYVEAFCRAWDRGVEHVEQLGAPSDPCRHVARDLRIVELRPGHRGALTLLNTGRRAIDLAGWGVRAAGERVPLRGRVAPGARVSLDVELSGRAGSVQLDDRDDVLVDRWVYGRAEAGRALRLP